MFFVYVNAFKYVTQLETATGKMYLEFKIINYIFIKESNKLWEIYAII